MHLKLPFLLLRPLLLLLLASGAVYMAAGVAYGRSKQPPLDGDGAFAHPEGQGAITWHPHYELWGQGRMLVLDGWRYTKVSGHRNLPSDTMQLYRYLTSTTRETTSVCLQVVLRVVMTWAVCSAAV